MVNVKEKEEVFHINKLNKYFRRPNTAAQVSVNTIDIIDLIFPSENLVQRVKLQVLEEPQEKENLEILTVEENAKQFQELDINPDLNQKEKDDLMFLLDEFKIIFSDIPGTTNTIRHQIDLISDRPIQRKLYPAPLHLRGEIEKEVEKLSEVGYYRAI